MSYLHQYDAQITLPKEREMSSTNTIILQTGGGPEIISFYFSEIEDGE